MQGLEKHSDPNKPVELIIKQLKYLISSGQLNPGDRLLSERRLAEKFDVGRTHIREAIKRLEAYGILKTLPQSGTFVAAKDTSSLEDQISDTINNSVYDFFSLVESRLIMEVSIVRLACERRTDEDLRLMEKSIIRHETKTIQGVPAIEEDLLFHRRLADASKNQVMRSVMQIIVPDIMTNYRKYRTCSDGALRSVAVMEHWLLFDYIKNRDADAAVNMMTQHLKGVIEYARSYAVFEK